MKYLTLRYKNFKSHFLFHHSMIFLKILEIKNLFRVTMIVSEYSTLNAAHFIFYTEHSVAIVTSLKNIGNNLCIFIEV